MIISRLGLFFEDKLTREFSNINFKFCYNFKLKFKINEIRVAFRNKFFYYWDHCVFVCVCVYGERRRDGQRSVCWIPKPHDDAVYEPVYDVRNEPCLGNKVMLTCLKVVIYTSNKIYINLSLQTYTKCIFKNKIFNNNILTKNIYYTSK